MRRKKLGSLILFCGAATVLSVPAATLNWGVTNFPELTVNGKNVSEEPGFLMPAVEMIYLGDHITEWNSGWLGNLVEAFFHEITTGGWDGNTELRQRSVGQKEADCCGPEDSAEEENYIPDFGGEESFGFFISLGYYGTDQEILSGATTFDLGGIDLAMFYWLGGIFTPLADGTAESTGDLNVSWNGGTMTVIQNLPDSLALTAFAIPEPATALIVIAAGAVFGLYRRFFTKM
ncbi:MAG: hypothetical protein WC959_09430 [Kiritimatiellales bacterium]